MENLNRLKDKTLESNCSTYGTTAKTKMSAVKDLKPITLNE